MLGNKKPILDYISMNHLRWTNVSNSSDPVGKKRHRAASARQSAQAAGKIVCACHLRKRDFFKIFDKMATRISEPKLAAVEFQPMIDWGAK